MKRKKEDKKDKKKSVYFMGLKQTDFSEKIKNHEIMKKYFYFLYKKN